MKKVDTGRGAWWSEEEEEEEPKEQSAAAKRFEEQADNVVGRRELNLIVGRTLDDRDKYYELAPKEVKEFMDGAYWMHLDFRSPADFQVNFDDEEAMRKVLVSASTGKPLRFHNIYFDWSVIKFAENIRSLLTFLLSFILPGGSLYYDIPVSRMMSFIHETEHNADQKQMYEEAKIRTRSKQDHFFEARLSDLEMTFHYYVKGRWGRSGEVNFATPEALSTANAKFAALLFRHADFARSLSATFSTPLLNESESSGYMFVGESGTSYGKIGVKFRSRMEEKYPLWSPARDMELRENNSHWAKITKQKAEQERGEEEEMARLMQELSVQDTRSVKDAELARSLAAQEGEGDEETATLRLVEELAMQEEQAMADADLARRLQFSANMRAKISGL